MEKSAVFEIKHDLDPEKIKILGPIKNDEKLLAQERFLTSSNIKESLKFLAPIFNALMKQRGLK